MKAEVRPIPSRLLKSMGDMLRPFVENKIGLDLYAGSGAMGIRALEVGLQSLTFIESHAPYARAIGTLVNRQKLDANVVCSSVESFFGKLPEDSKFDLILADPPYPLWKDPGKEKWLLSMIAQHLAKEGWIVLKAPSRWLPPEEFCGLKLGKMKEVGDAKLFFLSGAL